MTRLTIAIPNFNGGEKLKKAITSCKLIKIPQDEFEILVVDNKSTDNSYEIIDGLKKALNASAEFIIPPKKL